MNANEAREVALKHQEGWLHQLDELMHKYYITIRQKAQFGHTSVVLFVENDWHKGVTERLVADGYNVTMFEYSNDRLSVTW